MQIISPDSFETQADFNMLNQLLKNPRYDIPERLRKKVITSIERVVDNVDSESNTILNAIKTLALLDKHNIELAKIVMPKRVDHSARGLTDEQLIEALKVTLKQLPPEIVKMLPAPLTILIWI